MIPEPDYRDDDNNKNNNNNNNRFNNSNTSSVQLRHARNGSPQQHRSSNGSNGGTNGTSHPLPNFDEDGLIIPRKLINPCIESQERKSVHKEMLWNQKVGKNVLNGKNELEKELAKRKDNRQKKELEAEKLSRRSSLERRLEEQQLKIKQHEGTGADPQLSPTASSSSPDKQPHESEFLKIYSKVKCATNSDNNNDNNNCLLKSSAASTTPTMTASKT